MKQWSTLAASILLLGTFQSIVLAQMPQREGISAIGWNGEYFLIGTYGGELVKFDGASFALAANLSSSVIEIYNFSKDWIIAREGFLSKYDGKSLSEILRGEDARTLACSTKECVIYTSTRKLYSYDGKALTELTQETEEELRGEYFVVDIIWDGRDWLLLAKKTKIFDNGTLLRYSNGKLSKINLPIPIAHIASNGTAWLLIEARSGEPYNLWLYSNGHLSKVKVPYEKFAVEQQPLKLFIKKVVWKDSSWLICTSYGDKYQRVLRFDEKSIAAAEEECEEEKAEWAQAKAMLGSEELKTFGTSEKEWLIAGKTANEVLIFYRYCEGKLEELPSPPVKLLRVDTIAYGSGYWLVGGTSSSTPPLPPSTPKEKIKVQSPRPTLLKFDGTWVEIPLPEEGITSATFNVVPAWNGKYWLLILYDPNLSPVFYRFDGVHFSQINVTTDLLSLPQPPQIRFFPSKVAWGNGYWLLDTSYSLVKYDGEFTVAEYSRGIYTPFRIKDMKWNGRYWLVLYDLAGTEGSSIIKYDGVKHELVQYKAQTSFSTQWPPVSDAEWGSGYWLIGTFRYIHPELPGLLPDREPSLIKYDGTTFVYLTNEFLQAVEKRQEGKALCGPVAVIMAALIPVVLRRKAKR